MTSTSSAGKVAQSVLDRLHGVGVPDLGLGPGRLASHGVRGLARNPGGLLPRRVLVAHQPLERREVGGRRDDADLGILAGMLRTASRRAPGSTGAVATTRSFFLSIPFEYPN